VREIASDKARGLLISRVVIADSWYERPQNHTRVRYEC